MLRETIAEHCAAMNVVAETNVIISAIFWPGDSRQCLALWARRRFHLAIAGDKPSMKSTSGFCN